MTALEHDIRPGRDDDSHWIVRGWVSELRTAPSARFVEQWVYLDGQHQACWRLLAESTVMVACSTSDASHIYGAVVFRPGSVDQRPVVHWLSVRPTLRRLGIGRALLQAATDGRRPILATHASNLLEDRELRARYNVLYAPHILQGIHPPKADPWDSSSKPLQ